MFSKDRWQEIFQSIQKNKLRTFLSGFTITLGILIFTILFGFGNGLKNTFQEFFVDDATNTIWIFPGRTTKPFKGYASNRKIEFRNDDIKDIKEDFAFYIDYITPRITRGVIARYRGESNSYTIRGIAPAHQLCEKTIIMKGRYINDNDIKEKKKICVIEEEIYKQLFDKDVYPIGTYIKLNGINYQVVGMYKQGQVGSGGPQGNIHIPFTTFQQVYNRAGTVGWFMITGQPEYDILQIEADVKLLLKNLHKVHPEDERAFGSFNLGEAFGKFMGFLLGMQFLTWFVGIATLIAGVFAIGNILLITVKERTKEIGIRRALGAKPWEIKRQIILESVFLTAIAGALGIIFGGLVLMIIDATAGSGDQPVLTNPTVDIPVVLIAAVTLVVLGTLIGLIPAQTAVSIKPIEALREE